MKRLGGIALALAIAALPMALAAPTSLYSVTSADIMGSAVLQGKLAAAALSSDTPLQPSISIRGESVDVVEWKNDDGVRVDGVAGALSHRSYGNATFQDAELHVAETRANFQIFLTAREAHLAVEAPSIALADHDADSIHEGVYFGNESEHKAVQLADTVMASINQGRLGLTGSFTIAMWEVDLVGTSQGNAITLRSGDSMKPAVPTPQGELDELGSGQSIQSFITVTNGTLTFDVPGSGLGAVYVAQAMARTQGTATLHDVLAAEVSPSNPRLLVQGPIDLNVGSIADGRFDVAVTQTKATNEDLVVVPAPPTDPATIQVNPKSAVLSWGPSLVSSLMALVVAGGLAMLASARVSRLRSTMAAERYHTVANTLPVWLASGAKRREVTLMKAIALLRLSRGSDAAQLLRNRYWSQPEPSTRDFLLSCAYAQQGLWEQAVEALRRCLLAEPGYILEVSRNPWIGQLTNHSAIKPLISDMPLPEGYS